MITPQLVFQEFMELYYNKPGIRPSSFKDIGLCDYTIARLTKDGCTIYNLTNGTNIKIDWKWLDLFSSLNTFSGHKIIMQNIEDLDNKIDKTIVLFLKFQAALDNRKGTDVLDNLAKLSRVKTVDFREWYLEEYGEILDPIEYTSLNNFVEI